MKKVMMALMVMATLGFAGAFNDEKVYDNEANVEPVAQLVKCHKSGNNTTKCYDVKYGKWVVFSDAGDSAVNRSTGDEATTSTTTGNHETAKAINTGVKKLGGWVFDGVGMLFSGIGYAANGVANYINKNKKK